MNEVNGKTSSNEKLVHQKIARLQRDVDAKPRVLDLFAGCGGFSLGFKRAGFDILGGVEIDPHAALTHAINFHGLEYQNKIEPEPHTTDITQVEPTELTINGRSYRDQVDVIIGGPPCQAYARVGRAKLREINKHPEAFRIDPRGNLYLRYLNYVSALCPLALVMENVPDALSYGGQNIAQEICDTLDELGYDSAYTILNSVFYGVPQLRDRLFLIAYRRELEVEIAFPQPTHYHPLPSGYQVSRSRLSPANHGELMLHNYNGVVLPLPNEEECLEAVSASNALKDLPRLTAHLKGGDRRGTKKIDEFFSYGRSGAPSDFAKQMRSWPGFEANEGTDAHVIRSLPRDYRIFKAMKAGEQYPDAHRRAKELFELELLSRYGAGGLPAPGSPCYDALEKEFVPPYDPGKFPNKWRKMEAGEPSRTLLAHLGKDSYTHIHYDSKQARTISVREAARLQSFPDGFRFYGSMNSAFRQIGNAVPPLLSWRIASEVRKALHAGKLVKNQPPFSDAS